MQNLPSYSENPNESPSILNSSKTTNYTLREPPLNYKKVEGAYSSPAYDQDYCMVVDTKTGGDVNSNRSLPGSPHVPLAQALKDARRSPRSQVSKSLFAEKLSKADIANHTVSGSLNNAINEHAAARVPYEGAERGRAQTRRNTSSISDGVCSIEALSGLQESVEVIRHFVDELEAQHERKPGRRRSSNAQRWWSHAKSKSRFFRSLDKSRDAENMESSFVNGVAETAAARTSSFDYNEAVRISQKIEETPARFSLDGRELMPKAVMKLREAMRLGVHLDDADSLVKLVSATAAIDRQSPRTDTTAIAGNMIQNNKLLADRSDDLIRQKNMRTNVIARLMGLDALPASRDATAQSSLKPNASEIIRKHDAGVASTLSKIEAPKKFTVDVAFKSFAQLGQVEGNESAFEVRDEGRKHLDWSCKIIGEVPKNLKKEYDGSIADNPGKIYSLSKVKHAVEIMPTAVSPVSDSKPLNLPNRHKRCIEGNLQERQVGAISKQENGTRNVSRADSRMLRVPCRIVVMEPRGMSPRRDFVVDQLANEANVPWPCPDQVSPKSFGMDFPIAEKAVGFNANCETIAADDKSSSRADSFESHILNSRKREKFLKRYSMATDKPKDTHSHRVNGGITVGQELFQKSSLPSVKKRQQQSGFTVTTHAHANQAKRTSAKSAACSEESPITCTRTEREGSEQPRSDAGHVKICNTSFATISFHNPPWPKQKRVESKSLKSDYAGQHDSPNASTGSKENAQQVHSLLDTSNQWGSGMIGNGDIYMEHAEYGINDFLLANRRGSGYTGLLTAAGKISMDHLRSSNVGLESLACARGSRKGQASVLGIACNKVGEDQSTITSACTSATPITELNAVSSVSMDGVPDVAAVLADGRVHIPAFATSAQKTISWPSGDEEHHAQHSTFTFAYKREDYMKGILISLSPGAEDESTSAIMEMGSFQEPFVPGYLPSFFNITPDRHMRCCRLQEFKHEAQFNGEVFTYWTCKLFYPHSNICHPIMLSLEDAILGDLLLETL
ncbi:hypothetical protein KP509_09G053900 [Ceratopteris richardii]|nr:hypothetical protein KP509_09G053900 [Ceratopteris richardii]